MSIEAKTGKSYQLKIFKQLSRTSIHNFIDLAAERSLHEQSRLFAIKTSGGSSEDLKLKPKRGEFNYARHNDRKEHFHIIKFRQ